MANQRRTTCRWMGQLLSLVGLLVGATGCGIDLEEQYTIDRLRVLGIVTEPPSVAYGDAVSADAYVARPIDATETLYYTWDLCVFHAGSAAYFACPEQVGELPFTNRLATGTGESFAFVQDFMDGDTLESVCEALDVVGSNPNLPAGISLPKCGSGLPTTLRVKICEGSPTCEDSAAEIAIRTVVLLREAYAARPDRNLNPALLSFSVDGVEAPVDGSLVVPVRSKSKQEIPLHVEVHTDSAQVYVPIRDGAVQAERTEDLQMSWHATEGDFFKFNSFFWDGKATFEELESNKISFDLKKVTLPVTVRFWFIIRDNRGGYDALVRTVQFVDGR